jgi:tetratricopeptide (TPR) repeat protein
LFYIAGQISEAIKYYSKALEYFRNLNALEGISNVLNGLGAIHEVQGQYREALVKFKEAFEIRKNLNHEEAAVIQRNIDRVKAKLEGRLG